MIRGCDNEDVGVGCEAGKIVQNVPRSHGER